MPDKIQGTAADVMKLWLVRVDGPLRVIDAHLLLTVHDELVIEAWPGDVEEVGRILRDGLRDILPIHLPLELAVGENWSEMTEVT